MKQEHEKSPLVSIIIPIYNTEAYLNACLESVTNQIYTNLEIICIDDGSTDHSVEILKEWIRRDSRIMVIQQEHLGASASRNNGVAKATGDYISFVDSDDRVDESFIRTMLTAIGESDICVCGFVVWLNGQCVEKSGPASTYTLSREEMVRYVLEKRDETHVVVNKLFAKDVLKNTIFPVGYTYEDMYGAVKSALNSKKVQCIPDCLYHYQRRENSSYTAVLPRQLNDLVAVMGLVVEELEQSDLYKKIQDALFWYLLYALRRINQLFLDIPGYEVEEYKTKIQYVLELLNRNKVKIFI